MPTLKNWSINVTQYGGFALPECPKFFLIGEVQGHPRLPDGAKIFTSQVKGFDWAKQEAQTLNTLYHLNPQEMDEEFAVFLTKEGHTLGDFKIS